MTDTLESALAFLAKYPNAHLFPAIWKDGRHIGLCKWGSESSNDPNKVRAWADMHPEESLYFCIDLKRSGLTVVDVDNKNGKAGTQTLRDLAMIYGDLPGTLSVSTPSGGGHLIYSGTARRGANRLGPGVDIPVMVPLPGSYVPGKGVYKVARDLDIVPLPAWVTTAAGEEPPPPESRESLIDLDQPQNIERAISYLRTAEPSVKGQGGDNTIFRVLCRVRDFGISEDLCFDLASREYNNERFCHPPWSDTELKRKVFNAYKYARGTPGADDPSQEFTPVVPDNLIQFIDITDLAAKMAKPRWTVEGYIEQQTVTVWYGASGSLKSFLAMDLGLHIAAGMPWSDGRQVDQGPVYYLAGEGHGGLSRRSSALLRVKQIARRVPMYFSPYAVDLDAKANVDRLMHSIRATTGERRPSLVILDTLATAFGAGDENSTQDMVTFLNQINRLKTLCGCSILIIHHVGHMAKDRPRGAYALMAGVDAHYLVERDDITRDTVCLRAPGKMKDGRPPGDTWFRAREVTMQVGELDECVTSLVLDALTMEATAEMTLRDSFRSSRRNGSMAIILDILGAQSEPITVEALKELYTLRAEALGLKFDRANYRRSMLTLSRDGVLALTGGKVSLAIKPIKEFQESSAGF